MILKLRYGRCETMIFRWGGTNVARTVFAEQDLSQNLFLGGKVSLLQPKNGYRAGVDPVLLAASVPAQPGESLLELGCGAGQAMLCVNARIPGLKITGVELQFAYADLARRNGKLNDCALKVHEADLTMLPDGVKQQQFDHVIANPPYYRKGAHSPSQNNGRRVALGEETPLGQWIDIAARRLRHKGYLHVIQRADRLPDVLMASADRLGSVEVLPLAPRVGRAAELVLVRARKGGRAAFRLHAPLVLHLGAQHGEDGVDYSPQVEAILRNGAALAWPT